MEPNYNWFDAIHTPFSGLGTIKSFGPGILSEVLFLGEGTITSASARPFFSRYSVVAPNGLGGRSRTWLPDVVALRYACQHALSAFNNGAVLMSLERF
jgi:hypothetical protein